MTDPLSYFPLKPNTDESSVLIDRLVACIPAATYEMETLCRLAGIKASRKIPTAAVECVHRPQLLLNPDFVEKYCVRDEHLFLLVMHELWHVLLAHTSLYQRGTMAHNIAFDAIINAGLARQFHRPEYRGFFEAINRADHFPGCLLRPPEGWPTDPVYRDDIGPPGTREIIERLYPPNNFHRWSAPLYQEILDLLYRAAEQQAKDEQGNEKSGEPTLLGDHSDDSQDGKALDDAAMRDVIQRVAGSWPPPPFSKSGRRGEGIRTQDIISPIGPNTEHARRMFSRVLQRAVGSRPGRAERKQRSPIPSMVGANVLPNPRDRMAAARQQLGVQGVLWGQAGQVQARVVEDVSRVHIYLDVSGSMSDLLPSLLGLLIPYVARKQAYVYQFSTRVTPLTLSDLRGGRIQTTGGTSINAVISHALEMNPPVRRIVIVTDGYVGALSRVHASRLEDSRMRVTAVLPAVNSSVSDLRTFAHSVVILPTQGNRLARS